MAGATQVSGHQDTQPSFRVRGVMRDQVAGGETHRQRGEGMQAGKCTDRSRPGVGGQASSGAPCSWARGVEQGVPRR